MRVAFATAAIAALALLGAQVPTVNANSLDHFSFAPITGPQTSAVPFGITILAQDVTNGLVTGFGVAVSLSAAGSSGSESITPTNSGIFSGGVWTGSVTITVIDSNIMLQASDGSGHTGLSNPFDTTLSHSRSFNLPASDIGYDPFSDRIYASVGSGTLSNTVTVIDPETASIGTSVQVGPGPGRIAVTDNGQYVYVGLSASNAVRRVDIASLTAGQTFFLPTGPSLSDMVPVPGAPASVTIATYNSQNLNRTVSIYDNGVSRPNLASGPNVVRFGGTSSILYGVDNVLSSGGFDFFTMSVNASGVTVTNDAQRLLPSLPFGVNIEFGGGFIFTSSGLMINAAASAIVGSFPASGPVWPDVAAGRVLFLNGSTLQAYDLNTSVLIGSQSVYGIQGTPSYLIWAGSNRVAFATGANVVMVDTGLVPSGGPADLALSQSDLPNPVDIESNLTQVITVTNSGPNIAVNALVFQKLPPNTVFVSAAASQGICTQAAGVVTCSLGSISNGATATVNIVVQPTQAGNLQTVASVTSSTTDPVLTNNVVTNVTTVGFAPAPDSVNILNLTTVDLTYDPYSARLYASVPDGISGGISNCVVSIDPATGLIGQQAFVGEGPGKLAVADNGEYLYVGLTGTNTVARLNLPSMVPGLIFPLPAYVDDMKELPGTPGSVAISLTTACCPSSHSGVAIYDDGTPRSTMVAANTTDPSVIVFGGTNTVLYGHDNATTDYGFYTMSVNIAGVTATSEVPNLPNASCNIAFGNGLIFSSTGAVIQPTNGTQVGTIPASGAVLPDFAEDRLFYLNGSVLQVFEANTFFQIGSVAIPGISGSASSLVRWGSDGLAFRTSGGQIFVVRTSFIPAGPSADLSVTSLVSPSPGELGITMTNNLTVTNNGPNNAGNVELFDQLPAGTLLNSAILSQGSYVQSNGVVTCDLGTLASGSSATASIIFTPLAGTVQTNALTNFVIVASSMSDPNYANNSTSVVTTAVLDSIGDGIPDWWRQEYFGSGNTTNARSCATCDPDVDGFSNLQEYLAGTNPTNNASYPINWPTLVVTNLVSGLSEPTVVTHAGDGSGRLFVCEQIGRVRIVTTNNVLLSTPFLNISARVNASGTEQGLLGLAFSPGFSTNGHFYVDYTDASNDVVVSRFSVSANPNVASTNEQKILVVPKPYNNHNGGQLAFGPDGYLYIGIGDGGSEGDPLNNGQTTTNLLGKVLRIDTEGATQPYGIPLTNPFVGNPAYRPEIWAYGLRNPWRFSFDRQTGNLYVGDVGQNTYEEIDYQPAVDPGGENYGWRWFEGDYPYNLPAGANTNNLTWPVAEYTHINNNCAVMGGYVYRNSIYPRMYGMYFFGDFCSGAIWGLTNQAGIWITNQLYSVNDYISSFGEDDAGNLYVARYYSGVICQIQDPSVSYTPAFAPAGGIYNSEQSVIVSSAVAGATIYFTTNGVNPTTNSPAIGSGGTVYVNTSLTLKALALAPGLNLSPVGTANYTLQVGTPSFNPPTSPILVGSPVAISTVTTGATIYYTTDGTTPTSNSPVYSVPITITTNTTLKAIGAKQSFLNSAVQTMTYAAAYAITTTSSPAGGGTTSGGGTVIVNSNTTVCASANACFSFVNWTDQNSNVLSTAGCYTFPVITNETVVANFMPILSCAINTASSPVGGGSTSGGGTVTCGSSVMLCAVPNASCYGFVNWTLNGSVVSTSACYPLSAPSNETFVANFAPMFSYTINMSSSPSVGGSTSGGGTVACGSNVVVCATPSPCYNFVNWIDQNSNVVSTSPCYAFTAVGNVVLVANYVPFTYGNLTPLHIFANGDGGFPQANLVQGRDGNFYGTTFFGGMFHCGTIFRISPSGNFTSLWSFANGLDGGVSTAPLVQGNDGNFYGTTRGLGYGPSPNGAVFRMTPSGIVTGLWSFAGGNDGAQPQAGLVQGSDGNFYGTASGGGAGSGTVFRISSSGQLSGLHSFTGSDGGFPYGGLVQASDGNFYGTTLYGGISNQGTVFRINSSGIFTSLWSFGAASDGAYPYGVLMQASDGNLYGTTSGSGSGPSGNGAVFRMALSGTLTTIHPFGASDGANPRAGLMQGSDGNFYGTTVNGGANGDGTLFRVTPAGQLTNLWSFTSCADGEYPFGGILEGLDGNLYGTAEAGASTDPNGFGSNGYGTVFRINSGLCVYDVSLSSSPLAGGLTAGGGTVACGSNMTVCATPNACYGFVNWTDQNSNVVSASACYAFTAATNVSLTANFAAISSYTITTTSSPSAGGSTSGGGTVACGSNVTVCATPNACYGFVNWTDQNSNVVSASACYAFTAATNVSLTANFAAISSYTITTTSSPPGYGSTSGGGTVTCGSNVTVCGSPNAPCDNFVNWTDQNSNVVSTSSCFTFTPHANANLTAHFAVFSSYTITTGSSPAGGGSTTGGGTIACGSNVTVCATAKSCYSFVNWTDQNSNVISASACYSFTAAANENLVANFEVIGGVMSGSLTSLWSFTDAGDGANPEAEPVQGSDGNFYGTTYGSGSGPSGYGTVFRISPAGNLTNLWSFTGSADGAKPGAGLVQGSDGNFYGTTYGSGSGQSGLGTVFRISPAGNLTNLWSFTGGKDGANPYAGLMQGIDGNFYGTTVGSGSGPSAYGTVFRISSSGNLSNLWSFTGGTDGANPSAGLVAGGDGNFYGTTYGGGNGYGTIYRISPGGSLTKLWSFTNGLDGANSYATLIPGSDGDFYGTTSQGGANGIGTVFRISPTGNLTNLWEFTGCGDGGIPYAGLVQGSDGNFYGTTSGSGSGPSGYGTVFRITPSGDLATLHSFGVGDGANPFAGMVQGSDGSFYGTTYQGGTNGNYGTVFRLTVSLNPPANQISGIKLIGTSLVVSISSVAGETYQLQYSGSLTLSNWSNVGGASMTNSIGSTLTLTNFGGALQPQGFYRFDITP